SDLTPVIELPYKFTVIALVEFNGDSKGNESAVHNGDFPVLSIVKLPASGNNGRVQHRLSRRDGNFMLSPALLLPARTPVFGPGTIQGYRGGIRAHRRPGGICFIYRNGVGRSGGRKVLRQRTGCATEHQQCTACSNNIPSLYAEASFQSTGSWTTRSRIRCSVFLETTAISSSPSSSASTLTGTS